MLFLFNEMQISGGVFCNLAEVNMLKIDGMFLALIFRGYFNDFCLFEVERRFHVQYSNSLSIELFIVLLSFGS